jgi:hypothetical protein
MDFKAPIRLTDWKVSPDSQYYFRWAEGGDHSLPTFWLVLENEEGVKVDFEFRRAFSVEQLPFCQLDQSIWGDLNLTPYRLYELDFQDSDLVFEAISINIFPESGVEDFRISEMRHFFLRHGDVAIQIFAEEVEQTVHEPLFDARMYLHKA